jgi:hypothetical protein
MAGMRPLLGRLMVPFSLALALSTTSCGSQLVQWSATAIGCDPNDVEIWNEERGFGGDSWDASCADENYACEAKDNHVVCRQFRPPSVPMSVAALSTKSTSEGAVVRETNADGQTVLRLKLVEAGFDLRFVAVPALDSEHVQLTVELPATLAKHGCEPNVMVDSELLPRMAARRDSYNDPYGLKIGVTVPLQTAGLFTRPHRVAGRACSEEWRLSPSSQQQIEELLLRFGEELRWLKKPLPPSSRTRARASDPGDRCQANERPRCRGETVYVVSSTRMMYSPPSSAMNWPRGKDDDAKEAASKPVPATVALRSS